MKKFFSTLLVLMTLSSAALAYEGIAVLGLDGKTTIQQLNGSCDEDAPQPTNGKADTCDSKGKGCPSGYVALKKYCWGGWRHGFYHCGTACKERQPDCVWGHNSYICNNGMGPQ
ncbi:hypothetical protein [Bdellovibrio reynosensis]|uniref:Uncharacterized protein n=1 Tax=Bdellovibrio reynosensis TaxID=2835041 RepID=A0ABY4C6S8_9BACT|nr:hypothetical protein [Bdellovibrio reynosensis]UOF00620.1 hypothetical protein MNR06_13025 [Bdellovibrio reynosensis]